MNGFTDRTLAAGLIRSIDSIAKSLPPLTIMEVCGTHTMEIGRLGLRSLLPASLRLVSGPGCPVCVTPASYIDTLISYALEKEITVLAFGDMVRVPGSNGSLLQARARGADVRIMLSPLHAIAIAAAEPQRRFVVTAVGFETTIPAVARAITLAAEHSLENLTFLTAQRLVVPALDALLADPQIAISAFLLPGHVSAIIGATAYEQVLSGRVPGVIAGFDALDIVGALHAALEMIAGHASGVRNLYSRVVKNEGNPHARALINDIFSPCDAQWRGIGTIPNSGLEIRERYSRFDAARRYGSSAPDQAMPEGCSCGEVLRGVLRPRECPLFGTACTPDSPVGPCMVSSEGSCAASFRFGI